jgi:hypothetical protein
LTKFYLLQHLRFFFHHKGVDVAKVNRFQKNLCGEKINHKGAEGAKVFEREELRQPTSFIILYDLPVFVFSASLWRKKQTSLIKT